MLDTGQFFGRSRYEQVKEAPSGTDSLFEQDVKADEIAGYRRIDNITDQALAVFVRAYGDLLTKDDVFFYVYGLLHVTNYRTLYGSDLKKTLPRTPLVGDPWPLIDAGRALGSLHLNYENAKPYALEGLEIEAVGDPYDFFRITKLAYPRRRVDGKLVDDKTTVVCNPRITLKGVPEGAQR